MSQQESDAKHLRTYQTEIEGELAGGIAAEEPTMTRWIESTIMVDVTDHV